jgi:flagellar protein FlbD
VLQLTRLSGPLFALNPDLIERAEATPDTVVTLVNGSKYVIRETLDELVNLIQAYRADIIVAAHHGGASAPVTSYGIPGPTGSGVARSTPRPESTLGTVVALHPGDE